MITVNLHFVLISDARDDSSSQHMIELLETIDDDLDERGIVLGAEPLVPGWKQVRIRPQTGTLSFAKGRIPTPRGPIVVDWENESRFRMDLTLPNGVSARLDLPAPASSTGVMIDGQPAAATRSGSRCILDESP